MSSNTKDYDIVANGEKIAQAIYHSNRNLMISLGVYDNPDDNINHGRYFITDRYVLLLVGNDVAADFLAKINSYKFFKYNLEVGYTITKETKNENVPVIGKLIQPFSEDRIQSASLTDFYYKEDGRIIVGKNGSVVAAQKDYLNLFGEKQIYIHSSNPKYKPIEFWTFKEILVGLVMPWYPKLHSELNDFVEKVN